MPFRVRVDLHTYLHRMLVTSGEDVHVRWNTNCAKNIYDEHGKQTQYGLLYCIEYRTTQWATVIEIGSVVPPSTYQFIGKTIS
jgi:hypothetical protein